MSTPVQTEANIRREPASSFFAGYWQILLLLVVTLWLYLPTLLHLVSQWTNDRDFSHGFFVPLFSGFVIWQERQRLARIALEPSWWGAVIVVFSLAQLVLGQMGAELFLSRTSLVFLLAGLTILFAGWRFFLAVFFAWAFLFLMVPVPTIIFNQITFPLQILASKVAAGVLPIFHVPVMRQGNVMTLANMELEVADACSGIRSLLSLVTLAIIYGYLMERRLWVRYVLAFAAVPVAVLSNGFRIITTGLMVQFWNPELAQGEYHASWGWLVFVTSLLMLFGLHSLIRWIWPDQGGAS